MSIVVRSASLIDDREELLDLLERNFGEPQELRFAWRHESNPVGPGWSWVIYDRNRKAIVAMTSVFPRRMYVSGKLKVCGQVGEFAVDTTYRSLGPALQLQRATFGPVDSGAISLCYDCPPHDAGMSTFLRLGMGVNCTMTRYALPLRSDEFIRKRFGNSLWTKPVAMATNLLLRGRKVQKGSTDLEISKFDVGFDDEFSNLDHMVSSAGKIRASRSSSELNWRYRDDPMRGRSASTSSAKYRCLVARKAGELQGFAVFFTETEGIATLVDLFGHNIADTGIALLEAVIETCHDEDVAVLHGFCSDASDLEELFQNLGFRRREIAARVVGYEKPHATEKLLTSDIQWDFGHVELMV